MARGSTIETSLPNPEDEPLGEDEELLEEEEIADEPDAEALATETEARRQGWRPRAEFKGEPGTWVDAKEFLERGRNFTPFVRAEAERARRTNDALKAEVLGLRSEMGEVKKLAEGFRDSALKAEQRGYDRAMAEVKARQRAAAAEGNVEAYDAASAEAEALEADRPEATPPATTRTKTEDPQPQPQGNVDPEILTFVDANPWFMRDATLNNYMREVYGNILQTQPGLATPQALARAKNQVMQRFPEKFGLDPDWKPEGANGTGKQPAQRRRAASVIDPSESSAPPARGRNALTFNSIEDPTERAQAMRAYQAQKRHMPDFTEEQYMRLYINPKDDGLAIVRAGKRRQQPAA